MQHISVCYYYMHNYNHVDCSSYLYVCVYKSRSMGSADQSPISYLESQLQKNGAVV